jgi:hypothetical protein
MKTTRCARTWLKPANCGFQSRYFSILPVMLCLAFFWPFGGGKKIVMTGASEVPAAHGVIQVKDSANGNTQLDIKAQALAKPSALTPPEDVYVVWLETSGNPPKNAGALKVDKNLNGELKTVTAYKQLKVFITAEKYAQTEQPMGPTVLHAEVSR